MRIGRQLFFSSFLIATACSSPEPSLSPKPAQGPLAEHARKAALQHDVPPDLVLAIAVVERGLMLPAHRRLRGDDEIPIAGILELRRAHFDSLARGAELSRVSEERLQIETDLGTEAGILVLAELGREEGATGEDWRRWASAVERLSGYRDGAQARDYAAEVFRTLRAGGDFPARDGEMVRIEPHSDIPIELTMAPPLPKALSTPDHPDAIWFPTSCTNKCNTTRNQPIDSIVIHDTEGGWHASVATLQYDPNKSVHYIIDEDGSRIGQFIPESYMGWHAGNSCWNNRSIGIEHVGYAAKTFDMTLYEKSVELVKGIRSRHPIPLDRAHIIGHYQVPNPNTIGQCVPECKLGLDACIQSRDYGGASNHYDPGYNWQWCQYMEMLGGSCECNDAYADWNCTTDGTQMWRCHGGVLDKRECAEPCAVMPKGTPDECTPLAEPDAGAGADTDGDADADASTSEPLPWPSEGDAGIRGEAQQVESQATDAQAGCSTVASGSSLNGNRGIVSLLLALAASMRRKPRR